MKDLFSLLQIDLLVAERMCCSMPRGRGLYIGRRMYVQEELRTVVNCQGVSTALGKTRLDLEFFLAVYAKSVHNSVARARWCPT